MKLFPYVAIVSLAAGIAATPAFSQTAPGVLFEFTRGVGAQPFRSAANAPVVNTVAGVSPGGAPWLVESLRATIGTDGSIRASVRGILLIGTDNLGTRGGPRQMVISLFCRNTPIAPAVAGTLQTVSYDSPFADLDQNGDFQVTGRLVNNTGAIPPANCGNTIDNRPVLLVRTVVPANTASNPPTPATPGAWFAAGLLKAGPLRFGR